MKLIEKKETIIYVCYSVTYYCVGYLEHHTMSNENSRFYSHYNFVKLEHIKNHRELSNLLSSQKFKKVYTDLAKGTELFKQLRRICLSSLMSEPVPAKTDLIKDYQNLRGIIQSDKVSITVAIKEAIERYSNLIDLEREFFPVEIRTLGRLSYLVK